MEGQGTCTHCISPMNHGDVTTIAPCKECAALVCADHRELHFNLVHLTIDDAKKQAVSLAWNDLMGFDDPDFPGYPFAAVQYRKSLPEHIQSDVEEALVYVYHHEATPPEMEVTA